MEKEDEGRSSAGLGDNHRRVEVGEIMYQYMIPVYMKVDVNVRASKDDGRKSLP